MNETPETEFSVGTTLAEILARSGCLPPNVALPLVLDVAGQVQKLHARGLIHRSICLESVAFEANRKPVLGTNMPHKAIEHPIDPDLVPPELSSATGVRLARSIEHARSVLRSRRIELDPRRVDVYQLAAVLCRVLTGHGVSDYLRSAAVKGALPERLSRIIDSGLGFDDARRCSDMEDFAALIRAALLDLGHVDAAGQDHETSTSVLPPSSTDETTVASAHPAQRDPNATLPFGALGHYTILEKIGHGGMGDVYRAHDNSLGRTIALKVLPAELARQEQFIQRFRAEATAAARLTHPNIVQIYSIDQDAGFYFFTMQFVEGKSLADVLRERVRLSVDETLNIVMQLLGGLAAAHKQGLVHRDIKPANVLIDEEHQRALLADFGLVKSLGTTSGQTATGVVLGTVDYISPEQGRGHPVDQRSDLYSIGVLAYQMLTGELPFEADTPTAMIFQHVYETPKDLAEVVSDVPVWLTRMVTKLLSKDPADRYHSAAELLEELRSQINPPAHPHRATLESVVTAPDVEGQLPRSVAEMVAPGLWPNLRDRLLIFLQRNTPRLLERMASTQQQVDAAIAGYEAGCRELQLLSDQAHAVVDDMKRQATLQQQAAQRWREEASLLDDKTERDAACQQRDRCECEAEKLDRLTADQQHELDKIQIRLAKANATLTQLRTQRDVLNARLELARASLPLETRATHRRNAIGSIVAVTLLLAAFAVWRGGMWRDDTATEVTAVDEASAGESGRDAVDGESATIELAPDEMGRFVGHSEAVLALAISADGSTLLSGSDDKTALVWNVPTREAKGVLEGHNLGVRSIRFLPEEEQVVTAGADHVLRRWDLQTEKTLMIYSGHSNEVASVAVSGDGERFVSGSYDAGIVLWERDRPTPGSILEYKHESDIPPLRSLEDINALEAHVTWVRSVCFSPDDRHFVSGGNEALLAIWDVAERKIVRRLVGHRQPISQVIYSGEGERIISSSFDATIRVWDAETGSRLSVLSGHSGPVLCLALSPDGRFLATGSPDLTVRIWDLETSTEVQQFEGHTGQIEAVVWCPDGRSLFSASADHTVRQWNVSGNVPNK